MNPSAREAGFRMPAEWEPHLACWLAYPHLRHEWLDDFELAREEMIGLARAIEGESVHMLVPAPDEALRAALPDARFFVMEYGDSWTRDTAPIFLTDGREVAAACFRFNGWGSKYLMPGDDRVAVQIAEATGLRFFRHDLILEGGAIDTDGEGTLLTTRQCLLNENRNPGMDQATIEQTLRDALGIERILWLDEGLQNDHTDGHVDTLARFVAPGRVVCMEPAGDDDPNAQVLRDIARALSAMTDARGRRLQVERIPSAGHVTDSAGRLMPASYCNFYIANESVVVPQYGTAWDEAAVDAVARLFVGRTTRGRSARAVLAGGGAFHCVTQQQPRIRTAGVEG